MRTAFCALVLVAFVATAASAKPAPSAKDAAVDAAYRGSSPAKTLYICDNSAMTKRAFAREFGRAEFVTAEAATVKGDRWERPKCITDAEARRLQNRLAVAR